MSTPGRWTEWAKQTGHFKPGHTIMLGTRVLHCDTMSEDDWRDYAIQTGSAPLFDAEVLSEGARLFDKLRRAQDPEKAIRDMGRLPGREGQQALAHALLYIKRIDPKKTDAETP